MTSEAERLDEASVTAAAQLIADTRLRRGPFPRPMLPGGLRPRNVEDGYRIQARARAIIAEAIGPPLGWKVGSTSPGMQAFLGIAYPCAGTLYERTIFRGGTRLHLTEFFRLGLECELAVRLGSSIATAEPSDRASLLGAVTAVMTSVEIVEWRWSDWEKVGVGSLIADDFFSWGCVLGPERSPAILAGPANIPGGFTVDGVAGPHGLAAAILGHPINSLGWLAAHLRSQGTPLREGDIVTLGAIGAPLVVAHPSRVVARFEGIGEAAVEIV